MKALLKKINADTLGISASLACAIHCAVLPLFFSSLPVFGLEILHNKIFEYSMIGLAAVIGCYSLYHGFKKHHHKKLPLFVFITGLIFLVLKEVFISIELWLLIACCHTNYKCTYFKLSVIAGMRIIVMKMIAIMQNY